MGQPPWPGRRLHRLHVDGVDVGPLLAVHLDAHEVLVQVGGGGLVLEGLVRHDVAPVAAAVPDAEQHRHPALAGLLEGLGRPGPPVDRVVGVLEEIGGRLVGQAIRHGPILAYEGDGTRLRHSCVRRRAAPGRSPGRFGRGTALPHTGDDPRTPSRRRASRRTLGVARSDRLSEGDAHAGQPSGRGRTAVGTGRGGRGAALRRAVRRERAALAGAGRARRAGAERRRRSTRPTPTPWTRRRPDSCPSGSGSNVTAAQPAYWRRELGRPPRSSSMSRSGSARAARSARGRPSRWPGPRRRSPR